MKCLFCEIVAGRIPAEIVWRGEGSVAFLDHKPLFPGHVLLIPDGHYATLADVPSELTGPLFQAAQKLQLAVERATNAEGSFLAINNRVSQSVPHLHVHIVPRSKGDGLKGFFWPRRPYESDEHLRRTGEQIRQALDQL
jgi:histidine triad (HIT) family protein